MMAKKIDLNKIAYEPHPVSMERKRELNSQGFKIIDAIFRDPLDHDGDGKKGGAKKPAAPPADGAEPLSEVPDGIPTPIPEDWETMHHTKQISLAKALAGDFTAPEGQTMTEKAKSIILAAVTDRANPPAKSA